MAVRVWSGVAMVLGVVAPAQAFAQPPWIPAKGETQITTACQWLDADRHLFSNLTGPELAPVEIARRVDYQSNSLDFGRVQASALVVDGDIGITGRLALSGSLAFIAPRYRGAFPHPGLADDGRFHATVQDVQVGARYRLGNETWTVTPFSAFTAPVRDYEVLAHAAQGLHSRQLEVGASLGRIVLAGGAARGYLMATYGYSFVEHAEELEEVSLNRSRAMFEGGVYFGRVTLQGTTSWRRVHGGLEWSEVAFGSHDHFPGHDQAAATREWRYGAGVSFEMTPATSLEVSYGDLIKGANTHDARTIGIAWSWAFQLFGEPTLGSGFK